MLVQALKEIQDRCGYLTHDEMHSLSKRTGVPLHRIHEVASFYPLYRLEPAKGASIKVCRDMACHIHGAPEITQGLENLSRELGPGKIEVCGVSCLGQCDATVAALINDHHVYRGMDLKSLSELARKAAANEELPHQHLDNSTLPFQINPYQSGEPYEAVKQFVAGGMDHAALLKKMEVSVLRGMGGAGFPTFRKWSAVKGAPGNVKYIVCNADESEPGTFKDRELMRRAPYLVIEGMVLAALITGAEKGYLYIRHEYIDEVKVLKEALITAAGLGVIGKNVLGTGKKFMLELFISPGGYVQGEESALLEAIEDKRGEPRNKPPFPVFEGLFGKPTVINNVETLSWIPGIALNGGEWYRDKGIRGATGMLIVSISGDVQKPGVYEVPFGQTVKELIFDTAGGMLQGHTLKAIATSGPSGGFLPAKVPVEKLPPKFVQDKVPAGVKLYDILELPLDLNTVGQMGGMLGAAFIVYDDRRDMLDNALNCVSFYRNESCGKCVPCRTGSQKLVDIITNLMEGKSGRKELGLINELGETMGITSICGLGQVASNPITSLLKFFPEEVENYLKQV